MRYILGHECYLLRVNEKKVIIIWTIQLCNIIQGKKIKKNNVVQKKYKNNLFAQS